MGEAAEKRRASERLGRMMRKNGLWTLVWTVCLVMGLSSAQISQLCPSHTEIAPCSCSVKKSGLDIVCEFTDLSHISKVMSTLKGKPNTVIFYLRLRHNSMAKLQPYVFLGLDIRHLTIHNSSLAVLEESSLSSIGKSPLATKQFQLLLIAFHFWYL